MECDCYYRQPFVQPAIYKGVSITKSRCFPPLQKTARTREAVVDNQKVPVPVSALPPAPMPFISLAAVPVPATPSPTPSNEAPCTFMQDQGVDSGLEWSAAVTFKHFELNGSFSVIFFLGPVPEDPNAWEIASNTIGVRFAYINESAARGAKRGGRANILQQACVSLDDGIIKHSGLTHLSPENVVPYLTENLNWRVIQESHEFTCYNSDTPLQFGIGEVKEVQLPSLEVPVLAVRMSRSEGALFPVAGETVAYPDITRGKVGGSRE